MKLATLVLGVVLGLASLGAPAAAMELKGTTVILIHGKAGGQGPLQPLAAALKAEGARVVLPRMSWVSGYRTYEQTLGEVQAAVQRARASGAARVVLMGHSLGANISMGYAARAGGVAAVVALAPGHRPDFIATRTEDSLAQARAMVAAGRGGEKARFLDFNQGRSFPVTTTAEAMSASSTRPARPPPRRRGAASAGRCSG